jgi:asparagine N-glycosylation enzyme membrane subunit Stt3
MKYKIGDKVVPFQKTVGISFEDSKMWEEAKQINQKYLFIIRDEDTYYVLSNNKDDITGDYFNECDFYLYEGDDKMIDNELNKKLDEMQSQLENELNDCRNRFNVRLNQIRQEIKKESFIKIGQDYWYIDSSGITLYDTWGNYNIDNYRLIHNNVWLNEADCKRYAGIDQKYRRLVFDENLKNPIDKDDNKQKKYYLFYNFSDDSIGCNFSTSCINQNIYCTNENIKQLAIDIIGEDDLKWYLKEYRA